jgi:4-hydroxy-3-methylbut-2-enyl diphosphate reductase
VILAQAMGFCFGVRDALELAGELERPEEITIYGELVHNEAVQNRLAARGYIALSETGRLIPATPAVMITAHGISQKERSRLEDAGKRLIDTTCPLVKRVHKEAEKLRDQGYFVVVIGKKDHVEVLGITGDLERFAVVSRVEEVRPWPAEKLAVICQTTTAPSQVPPILRAIEASHPGLEVRFVDTICKPTKERQSAAQRLLTQVQALVVVGGKNSNNTRALAEMAREKKVPCLHVQGVADLEASWFEPFRDKAVGLTAGTSTPDEIIRSVHNYLLDLAARWGRVAGAA